MSYPPPSVASPLLGLGRTTRWTLVVSTTIAVVGVSLGQLYFLTAGWLTQDEANISLLAAQAGLLCLLLLGSRLQRRPLRDFGFNVREPVGDVLGFATLLTLLFVVIRFDSGFFFGFGKVPLTDPTSFGFLLFYAPVSAVAQVGLFYGYFFRTLTRMLPLRSSIVLASVPYAIFSTDLPLLSQLGALTAVQVLLTTTVVSFVLGLVVALYFYKSRWSLIGPVATVASIQAVTTLLPLGVQFPSWEVNFVSSLIASAVLLIVVGLGLRESRLQSQHYLGERVGPRRYRFRNRARERASARGTLVSAAVVGVAALTFAYGLPTVLGTSTPVLAIASGSMVPTFERGDLVVVQHIDASSIHVGTIIVFSVACLPSPTVHRVVKIVSVGPNWVFQTKGDANRAQDPCTVPYTAVHGSVVGEVPYLGYLILDPLFAGAVLTLAILIPLVWRGEDRP
ncbi:MAG TPA: signal peptidase I [Thermoplasmata archaeon]|nr:signal peptidase I [Thermoplasmata archaeon]